MSFFFHIELYTEGDFTDTSTFVSLRDTGAIENTVRASLGDDSARQWLAAAADTGAVRKSRTSRKDAFPVYNSSTIRRGLTYSLARKRGNTSGWTAAYSLLNKSRIGAIVEIAGTKNPYGDPRSRSNNPQAGRQFIEALNTDIGTIERVGKGRGRLMYQALAANQGRARDAILRAIEAAATKYKAATR